MPVGDSPPTSPPSRTAHIALGVQGRATGPANSRSLLPRWPFLPYEDTCRVYHSQVVQAFFFCTVNTLQTCRADLHDCESFQSSERQQQLPFLRSCCDGKNRVGSSEGAAGLLHAPRRDGGRSRRQGIVSLLVPPHRQVLPQLLQADPLSLPKTPSASELMKRLCPAR